MPVEGSTTGTVHTKNGYLLPFDDLAARYGDHAACCDKRWYTVLVGIGGGGMIAGVLIEVISDQKRIQWLAPSVHSVILYCNSILPGSVRCYNEAVLTGHSSGVDDILCQWFEESILFNQIVRPLSADFPVCRR